MEWSCDSQPLLAACVDHKKILIFDGRYFSSENSEVVTTIEPENGVHQFSFIRGEESGDSLGTVVVATKTGSLEWWAGDGSFKRESVNKDSSIDADSFARTFMLPVPSGAGVVLCRKSPTPVKSHEVIQVGSVDPTASGLGHDQQYHFNLWGQPRGVLLHHISSRMRRIQYSTLVVVGAIVTHLIQSHIVSHSDSILCVADSFSLEKLFKKSSPRSEEGEIVSPCVPLASCHDPILGMRWGTPGELKRSCEVKNVGKRRASFPLVA